MRQHVCVAAIALLLGSSAIAQSPEVSDEHLELLEDLSPEQRDALLEQLLGSDSPSESEGSRLRDRGDRRDANGKGSQEQVRRLSPLPGDREEERAQGGLELADKPEEPRLEAKAQVIVDLDPIPRATDLPPLPEEEEIRRTELRDRLRRGNPYRLDASGLLQLPGFEPLPMLGLTEELAAKRLATDPDLSIFRVRVTLLPLEASGEEALEPFGYDLFTDAPSTFAPHSDGPVPSGYAIGPGDVLRIQLFGNTNRTLSLEVGRDGQIDFPQIGPIAVEGMTFADAKEEIEGRVAAQMIGVRANVEMGETRSIRVLLLGEVARPGSYTMSGLATVTNALFVGGGISRVGSLRNVQLKRSGKLIKRLDLYDLLLRGDTSADASLLPGDVVFIPPVGPTASAGGELQRPAIYELEAGTTIDQLVQTAGGMSSRADPSAARLERINERGERVVLNLDLATAAARATRVHNGDRLHVAPIRDTLEAGVVVEGHVLRPGAHEYRPGLRVSDVLSFADLRPKADTHYLLIRRESPPDRRLAALSCDLSEALRSPGSEANVLLEPRDRITVFDLQSGRDRVVSALLRDLRGQATLDQPMRIVSVAGRVRAPGQYPLEENMRVSDLLRAGGSLEDAAYGGKAELTRHRVEDGEERRADLIEVDLGAVLRGDAAADIALEPYDALTIKELPEWREEELVTILGEVRFPGAYSLRRGETLHSVISRAGGLTDLAFPEGSVLLRRDLREREQRELDLLQQRLRRDLAILALQGGPMGTQSPQALVIGEDLIGQLQTTKATGRLVIDFPALVAGEPGGPADVLMKPGDRLLIPKESQEVTVIGEVQNPTSHRFVENLTRDEYIDQSGGYTNKADKRRAYVVRASGSVETKGGGAWFEIGADEIRPGDTVVVPLNAERIRPIALWTAVTQILYNLAIAAAAVNSF